MNKKQSKRQRDIKTKLMAAICMLLVSSIMMVSTTYAWFTLSTAPEVTGINTAVGANGNLEMALVPLDGDTSKIGAKQGDSMAVQDAKSANVTWGNLVDLKNGYGLDQIVLYPSELNVTSVEGEPAKIATTGILKTPTYGADGRIADLNANTFTGVYTEQGGFYQNVDGNENPYGVRGIGTISTMSARELAFRLAMSNGSTSANQASGIASAVMSSNGPVVAQIALDHATGNDAYDSDDVNGLLNIVVGLKGGTGKIGALTHMEAALKQYILAASIAPVAAETNFQTIVDAVDQETVTVYDMADGKITNAAGAEVTLTVPSEIVTHLSKLEALYTTLSQAETDLNEVLKGTAPYDWDAISEPMATLINLSAVYFDGPDDFDTTPDDDVDPTDDGDTLPDKLTMEMILKNKVAFGMHVMQNGMTMTMGAGSGIFADLADFCGDFTSEFTMYDVKAAVGDWNVTIPKLDVRMNADTTLGESDIYLTAARTAVGGFSGADGGGGNNPISDFYGYIIDMAFRTNAAGSYLKLQQTPADRIYADGTNTNTQGGGASMTFTSGDPDNFSVGSVKSLMGAIKIVFFDPSAENEIIGYAKLDTVNIAKEENGSVTMYLVMCDKDGEALKDDAAVKIMDLNQNQIHQLSVLVYLDGNQVGNDDVATAAKSMTGSMNLQFSSSATLVAMDYANLKSGNGGALNGGAATPDEEEPTATQVTVTSITEGYSATAGFGTYSGLKGICAKITATGGAEITATEATVTIDGQGANYVPGAGWVVAANEAPSAGVVIVVTPAGG